MTAVASYAADTSALARLRHQPVPAVLGPLIEAGLVATCGLIEFELGWATRTTAEFHQLRADRDAGYEWFATDDEDWRRALDVGGMCGHRRYREQRIFMQADAPMAV
jgi:hypothetical protein